jgi:hypothetical protein
MGLLVLKYRYFPALLGDLGPHFSPKIWVHFPPLFLQAKALASQTLLDQYLAILNARKAVKSSNSAVSELHRANKSP